MKWAALFVFLLLPSVLATSIVNTPPLEERDIVLTPGMHLSYSLPVGGAELIDVAVSGPPAIQQYVTLEDPSPRGPARVVRMSVDIPKDAQIPPGIYGLSFTANEIPQNTGQVSTAVSVSLGFIFRVYSRDPYLEVQSADFTATPQGERTNFTVYVISRTTQDIPYEDVKVEVLDAAGNVLATGTGTNGVLPSGQSIGIPGKIDTRELAGGIYPTRVTVSYNGPAAVYDKAILRIGTLTIDLDDYTKGLVFNQTNKFQFTLKSNWNKPLTNVLSKVTLLGQTKASAPVTIDAFSKSEQIEVYFDRTETPPGPVNGTLTVSYQERSQNPALQDTMETHEFTIPLHLEVVLPQAPAKVHTTWKPSMLQIVIVLGILLVIANIIILFIVLRKREQQ